MKIEKGQEMISTKNIQAYTLPKIANQNIKKEETNSVGVQNETLDLLALYEEAKQQKTIRTEKIREISTKIEKGEYNITGRDVVLEVIGEMYFGQKNNRTI